MNLESKIVPKLKEAMKAKDQGALRALRAIKAEILLLKTSGAEVTIREDDEIKILQKMLKQRNDSLVLFEKENREDLARKEREEIEVIQQFLPKQLSEEELTSIIKEIIDDTGADGMKDMGKVMGAASKRIAGRADNKKVAEVVKQSLMG